MIMLPLPFFFAAAVVGAFYFEWRRSQSGQANYWFLALLALIIFQELLIGFRFGYGQDWLKQIQPVSAAGLPPLAYLSFRKPVISLSSLAYMAPIGIVLFILAMFIDFLDTFLAANNLFFAIALLRLGLSGHDALGWVETHRIQFIYALMWFVFALLIISGIADAAISYDYWTTDGDNTGFIVGWASVIGIFATTLIVAFISFRQQNTGIYSSADTANQQSVFEKLATLLARDQLYLDPDINLNRIAKRLSLPVREVSRAVNGQTNQNFSQYINELRVNHACHLISSTDMQITHILYAAGFNTKSNFNREFARITSTTPSQWRNNAGKNRTEKVSKKFSTPAD